MRNIVIFGVDPQNDFGHPLGSLYCKDAFRIVGGGMILIERATKSDWLVMFSADWHPKNSDHFKPKGPWPPHCVYDTWGAKFLAGVKVPCSSPIFLKGAGEHEQGYDPFEGNDGGGRSPEQVLDNPSETTIIAWGIATNYCVRSFVLTARKKGYEVYVALDACAPVPTPTNPPKGFITEEQAIEEMKTAGAILTTVEKVISGKLFGGQR